MVGPLFFMKAERGYKTPAESLLSCGGALYPSGNKMSMKRGAGQPGAVRLAPTEAERRPGAP